MSPYQKCVTEHLQLQPAATPLRSPSWLEPRYSDNFATQAVIICSCKRGEVLLGFTSTIQHNVGVFPSATVDARAARRRIAPPGRIRIRAALRSLGRAASFSHGAQADPAGQHRSQPGHVCSSKETKTSGIARRHNVCFRMREASYLLLECIDGGGHHLQKKRFSPSRSRGRGTDCSRTSRRRWIKTSKCCRGV